MFDKQHWQEQISAQRGRFNEWLAYRANRDAPYVVYGGVLAATLWPAIEAAAQTGQFYPVIGALYGIVSGVGAGLVANQLEQWRGRADPVTLDEVAGWITAAAPVEAELRQALDELATQLESLPALAVGLSDPDRSWFEQTLRREMAALGNLPRFEATLSGFGAIAQGGGDAIAATAPGAVAIGSVGGGVQNNVQAQGDVAGRDQITVYASEGATVVIGGEKAPVTMTAVARKSALGSYLQYLIIGLWTNPIIAR